MEAPLFVGTGPVLVDLFVHCDQLPEGDDLPRPGAKRRADSAAHFDGVRRRWVEGWTVETQIGGPVLVALRQAKALGAEVDFVGAVGDDEFGDLIAERLQAKGFHPETLVVQKGRRSGTAIIWIDRHGERSILFEAGTLDHLEPKDVARLTKRRPDVAHIDSREPAAAAALAAAARYAGVPVHYDIDPWEPWSPQLLNLTDVAQISFKELENHPDFPGPIEEKARTLRSRFGLRIAIITKGEDGLFAIESDGTEHDLPPFRVDSADSVGAGDVFAGALETALLRGTSTRDALRFASATGALHSTRLGNRTLPAENEIMRLVSVGRSL